MEWLNYHHLLYFFTVAREGGLAPAGRLLRLSHSTLSSQIHALEDRLGEKLFQKEGRRLVLTETGKVVFRYADEIFGLGKELLDVVRGKPPGRTIELRVGVVDVVPKMAVHRMLFPAITLTEPVRMICREGKLESLLAQMAAHELDVIVADEPLPSGNPIKAFAHFLGESGQTLFAAPALARSLKKRFPKVLDGAPFLLPAEGLSIRRAFDRWFDEIGARPRIIAEFEDSALMKSFGAQGIGIFPGPTAIEKEIVAGSGVKVIGRVPSVVERFFVITPERRIKNPAVMAIASAARKHMFD